MDDDKIYADFLIGMSLIEAQSYIKYYHVYCMGSYQGRVTDIRMVRSGKINQDLYINGRLNVKVINGLITEILHMG